MAVTPHRAAESGANILVTVQVLCSCGVLKGCDDCMPGLCSGAPRLLRCTLGYTSSVPFRGLIQELILSPGGNVMKQKMENVQAVLYDADILNLQYHRRLQNADWGLYLSSPGRGGGREGGALAEPWAH
jgi:hypothetical protein